MDMDQHIANMDREVSLFRDILDRIIEQEREMLKDINAEMKILPEGTLSLWHKGGDESKTYFSMRRKGKNSGITRNTELIYLLARKKYLSLVKKDLEDDFAVNREMAKAFLNKKKRRENNRGRKVRELLLEYAKEGLDIARITMTKEQYQWMHSPFDSNEMNPEELIYETYSGVLMRSKSEQSIGNRLELYGIPYRYEQAVTLDVSWMDDENGEALYSPKTYYPDFIIMTANGEFVVWEHLGRVDLYKYRIHNMEKICAYRQGGEIDSRHLILTFESDLRRLGNIDEIITKQILCADI